MLSTQAHQEEGTCFSCCIQLFFNKVCLDSIDFAGLFRCFGIFEVPMIVDSWRSDLNASYE